MALVRVWLLGSALALSFLLVWAFVPILIPLAAVAAGLGGVTTGMVLLARVIERRRRPGRHQDEGNPPV